MDTVAALLRVALQRRAGVIKKRVLAGAERLDVDIDGVPHLQSAHLRAVRALHDETVLVLLVSARGSANNANVTFFADLPVVLAWDARVRRRPHQRTAPSATSASAPTTDVIISTRGIRWTPASGADERREVIRIAPDGSEVWRLVPASRGVLYEMTCGCGRRRFAPSKAIHQVDRCHVCTWRDRLDRRANNQFRARNRNRGMSTQ